MGCRPFQRLKRRQTTQQTLAVYRRHRQWLSRSSLQWAMTLHHPPHPRWETWAATPSRCHAAQGPQVPA